MSAAITSVIRKDDSHYVFNVYENGILNEIPFITKGYALNRQGQLIPADEGIRSFRLIQDYVVDPYGSLNSSMKKNNITPYGKIIRGATLSFLPDDGPLNCAYIGGIGEKYSLFLPHANQTLEVDLEAIGKLPTQGVYRLYLLNNIPFPGILHGMEVIKVSDVYRLFFPSTLKSAYSVEEVIANDINGHVSRVCKHARTFWNELPRNCDRIVDLIAFEQDVHNYFIKKESYDRIPLIKAGTYTNIYFYDVSRYLARHVLVDLNLSGIMFPAMINEALAYSKYAEKAPDIRELISAKDEPVFWYGRYMLSSKLVEGVTKLGIFTSLIVSSEGFSGHLKTDKGEQDISM